MENEKKLFTLAEIEPAKECKEFIENSNGIFLSAEDNFRKGHEVLKPDTYRFAKWLRQNKSEISVKISSCENVIDLKSSEIWLPMVFLATNVALPLFLNFVYDYLKSMVRGDLSKDDPKAHLNVIYKDKGKFKKFEYNGPVEGLKKIKQFDINDFING
ncbi:MAG: hypothetical protein WBL85_10400 [Sedimentisphaerales bacterium]